MNRIMLMVVLLAGLAMNGRLSAQELSAREIYRRAASAVVVVVGKSDNRSELGTGSIVELAGAAYVITTSRIVTDGSSGKPFARITIHFKPGVVSGDRAKDMLNEHRAQVLRSDGSLGLALLRFEQDPGNVTRLRLGNSDSVAVGDRIFTIGHPEQGGLWTLTRGSVVASATNLGGVSGKDAFRMDASVSAGNDGGPLLDNKGEQIGLLVPRSANVEPTTTAVSYAIKSNVVQRWLTSGEASRR